MSSCAIHTPTVAILENVSRIDWEKNLKADLTYFNSSAKQALNAHRQNYQWKHSNIRSWTARTEELTASTKISLYSIQKDGEKMTIRCRPGSVPYLRYKADVHKNLVVYPEFLDTRFIYLQPLPFDLYPYQLSSVKALMEIKHGNVELCTGSGKSAIALELVRRCGLNCAIVVPGKENFSTLSAEFRKYFGVDMIGEFGDGKKQLGKPITIAIGKSVSILKSGTDAYKFFERLSMIIVDESHCWASKTMEAVCHGVFREIPFRFFLSGTQDRGVDEANLLRSIIGPCVYELGTAEAVKNNYIAYHEFKILKGIPAVDQTDIERRDALYDAQINQPMSVRRHAFLHNPYIAKEIAQRTITDLSLGVPSLILVDEVGQMGLLIKAFRDVAPDFDFNAVAFAHSEMNKDRLESLGLPPNKAKSVVDAMTDYNMGKKLVLIASSCIQTGASLFPVQVTYNFVGGGASNRIKTSQGSVGRSVRKWDANPYKDLIPHGVKRKESALIVDFDVDEPQMQKHLQKRKKYYGLSGTPIHEETSKFQRVESEVENAESSSS